MESIIDYLGFEPKQVDKETFDFYSGTLEKHHWLNKQDLEQLIAELTELKDKMI